MRRSERIARLRLQRDEDVEIVIHLPPAPEPGERTYGTPSQAHEEARTRPGKDENP